MRPTFAQCPLSASFEARFPSSPKSVQGRSLVLSVLMFVATCVVPQSPFALDHPHLFFTDADVPALTARMQGAEANPNDFYADMWNEIKIDARSTYGPEKAIPHDQLKRNYQAIVSHGAVLLLDPAGRAVDSRYQSNTRFFAYYNAILNDSRWSNFFGNERFDTTYMLIGLCIGYDWHYDRFSPSQRSDIVNKLASRADYLLNNKNTFFEIPANLDDPASGYLHTFKVLRNRDKIPVAALALIAYTLQDEVSSSRRNAWLAEVNRQISVWNAHVSPDGMSHEGYSYHEYMMQNWVTMLLVRYRKTGVNEFRTLPYIYNHPMYSIYSWVPGGDHSFLCSNPFGDSTAAPPAEMRTLDAVYSSVLAGDANRLDQLSNWMQWKSLNGLPNNSYSRTDPTHFFWANAGVLMRSPQQLGLPLYRYFPNRGGFTWRSGWDNMATYFSMICGPTIGGHQQPESGNFVIYRGGAPFIGHHGPNETRRTEDHNVMMIGGGGQWGDRYQDGNGITEPQPSSRWASITRIVPDDIYFNILCNLRPIYRSPGLNSYTREFMGTSDFILVRDKYSAGAGIAMQSIVHSYGTTVPGSDGVLNIDSNPLANPWSGGGRTQSTRPRTSGPFTGSLTIQDLSNSAWTPAISQATVQGLSSAVKRGYKLTRSQTAKSGSLLQAYYFPQGGDSVSPWPDPGQAEGIVVRRNGSVRLLTAWSNNGSSTNNSYGLTLNGAMAGFSLTAPALWTRDATLFNYSGIPLMSSSAQVSMLLKGGPQGTIIVRILAPSTASVTFYCPMTVGSVRLDGVTMGSGTWLQTSAGLRVSIPASSQTRTLQIFPLGSSSLAKAAEKNPPAGDVKIEGNQPGETFEVEGLGDILLQGLPPEPNDADPVWASYQ